MEGTTSTKQMRPLVLVVMGVCGCGKSEIGQGLGSRYSCPFIDADAFHPKENVDKMAQGVPLDDDDRLPWLRRVREECLVPNPVDVEVAFGVKAVVGCSALKRKYRDILRGKDDTKRAEESNLSPNFIFIFLDCSRGVLETRLKNRQGHFMKSAMLDSQLSILEPPTEDEGIIVDGDIPVTRLLNEICMKLKI